ncbi:MAG: thioredoxin domain-containing protein [Novosphingobium sp.]|nr:thioredoxin domain-containing protein [Novosphingobium sp.]
MRRFSIRQLLLGIIALPMALGLAACGSENDEMAGLSGEVIEKVPPPVNKSWVEVVDKTPDGGFRMGNPEAPIKLIEFASLTCPHCKVFGEEATDELRDTFVASGRVSWEFRNFILNPIDLTMAMMVRCGSPESFFALTEQSFEGQDQIIDAWDGSSEDQRNQVVGLPPDKRYLHIAKLAGLPEFYGARGIAADQASACLADGAAAEALVNATNEQSEKYDIGGTPAFVINEATLDIRNWSEVKAKLETLGAR